MGMCLQDFGDIAIEVRSKSFIIHSSEKGSHPEYNLDELANLHLALADAIRYCKENNFLPKKKKKKYKPRSSERFKRFLSQLQPGDVFRCNSRNSCQKLFILFRKEGGDGMRRGVFYSHFGKWRCFSEEYLRHNCESITIKLATTIQNSSGFWRYTDHYWEQHQFEENR